MSSVPEVVTRELREHGKSCGIAHGADTLELKDSDRLDVWMLLGALPGPINRARKEDVDGEG